MRLDMRIHQSWDTKPSARTDNVVVLPADRPKPFVFFAIAMSALLLLATAPLTAARGGAVESAATPTIVLVHGAWADETGWNDVVARLQKDGYHTPAPPLGVIDPSAAIATARATLEE